MKKCLIRTPAGLGDILFCLKIGIEFSKTFDVTWPVSPHYSWLKDYLELPSNLDMSLTVNDDFEMKKTFLSNEIKPTWFGTDFFYLPLELASLNYTGELIMNSKYRLANMRFNDWKDYVHIKRNKEREQELLNSLPEKYNLICENFASPPLVCSINIPPPNNGLANVYINFREGFTPFDWMGVIENAETLHFVDTVYSYLTEMINVKAKELVLYSRVPGKKTWRQTAHLFKTNWKYV